MDAYTRELERLIIDELLPIYLTHARLTGDKDAFKRINPQLIAAMKKRRKVPKLLEKESYGEQ